jgi:hypothetical protein
LLPSLTFLFPLQANDFLDSPEGKSLGVSHSRARRQGLLDDGYQHASSLDSDSEADYEELSGDDLPGYFNGPLGVVEAARNASLTVAESLATQAAARAKGKQRAEEPQSEAQDDPPPSPDAPEDDEYEDEDAPGSDEEPEAQFTDGWAPGDDDDMDTGD